MTSRRVEPRPILAETGRPIMATISSARPSWQRGPVFKFFASLKLAVVLLAVLIVAAIAGTIWESSFDAKVARAYVYRAPWFDPSPLSHAGRGGNITLPFSLLILALLPS